jgi:hypothetical protein
LAAPGHAPLRPLFVKELREVVSGRALWTMLLILCPLVGYSFVQAVMLYSEASSAARDSPLLASGLSPLDGVLVPSFGALYLSVTLLFPFVAIRTLAHEKQSGALRLLVQLPYRAPTLIAAKMGAVSAAWLVTSVPAVSVLPIWLMMGGHLYAPETLNLLLGQLLYGLLVAAIALFSSSVSDSAATAAIIALAFTIGSWALDFGLAGQPGVLEAISRLSLTHALRNFEQGLLSLALVVGVIAAIGGFAALAAVWLHPGVPVQRKLLRSIIVVAMLGCAIGLATQIKTSFDVTEDGRNSFPAADQRALAELRAPLIITVHLAPEDPRYADLRRNILSKLERVLPSLTVRLSAGGQTVLGSTGDQAYGEVEYSYGGGSAKSRSTSHREVLPILYELAGKPVPASLSGAEYLGYPLVASADLTLLWFIGLLPLAIAAVWWRNRRAPRIPQHLLNLGGQT